MDSELLISLGALMAIFLMPGLGLCVDVRGPAPVPTDLKWHISRATDNIVRWATAMSGFDPVVAVRDGHPKSWIDLNHNLGRAIDGLLKGEASTSQRTPEQVVETLRAVLFATLDNEAGFPAAYDAESGRIICSAHDIREAVQALLELATRRSDRQAGEHLGRLLDTLLRITDDQGAYRPEVIAQIPLLAANSKSGEVAGFTDHSTLQYNPPEDEGFYYPQAVTVDRGRLIMALVQVYRHLRDERALQLARRFVHRVRSRCFTPEGQLLREAGSHTHSITGTVHGLAAFGILTDDRDTLEHARRVFEGGLGATKSSFGWSVENCWRERVVGRGEINNTGDMIQTALHFAEAGYCEYFEVAERMVRSHVLPGQWLKGQPFYQPEGAPQEALKSFPDDSDGGWGFPGVNDRHVPGADPDVLDITQGGIQSLWAVGRQSVTSDESAVRINMAFSGETDGAHVESHLPVEGRVTVTMKQKASLWFRKPSWLSWEKLNIVVDGSAVAVSHVGLWAVTPPQDQGTQLEVIYPLVRREQQEWINYQRYRFVLEGDTIVAMSPRGLYAPMYGALDD